MISLAHISPADHLRRNRERFASEQGKARAANKTAASGFAIGQMVRTRRGDTGAVVAIDAGKVSVEIDGSVRTFVASMLVAA